MANARTEFSLRDFLPRLIPFLNEDGRIALRATCREGRAVVDRAITTLKAFRGAPQAGPAESAAQIIAFIRGVLSRGCRPTELVLHPELAGGAEGAAPGAELNAAVALIILNTLREQRQAAVQQQQQQQHLVPPPTLGRLSLCNVPYTDALASAVHSAAPLLASLIIANSDLLHPLDVEEAAPGLCRLITTCAPHLTSLTFSKDMHAVPEALAAGIAACTHLQHLEINISYWGTGDTDEEDDDGDEDIEGDGALVVQSVVRLAEVVCALPSLRSLTFEWLSKLDDGPLLQTAVSALGRMTQLTSLGFRGPWPWPVRDVLTPLHGLARLSVTGSMDMKSDDLQPLAADLARLTYLAVDEADFDDKQQRGTLPLPPALRELHLGSCVAPAHLLALQLPPSLTRLSVPAISSSWRTPPDAGGGFAPPGGDTPSDGDEEGASDAEGASGSGSDPLSGGGSEESGEELAWEESGAVAAWEDANAAPDGAGGPPAAGGPPSCPGFDLLLESLGLLHGRFYSPADKLSIQCAWRPPAAGTRQGQIAGGGYARLFNALRPLGLRRLELGRCELGVRDVTALVEQLPELEDLQLDCQVHPAAVPLLARLRRLHTIDLRLPLGCSTDAWAAPSGAAVASALFPLLLHGPSLQHVGIKRSHALDCAQLFATKQEEQQAAAQLDAALRRGVRRLQQGLRRMGRDPQVVVLGETSTVS